jgi:sec-independent protein translocase protein TatC
MATTTNGTPPDPDDFFAETRMSFGDHIEELRTHLWRAIKGFAVALFFSFFIGRYVVDLITAPVKRELDHYYDRRVKKVMAEQANDPEFQKVTRPGPFRKIDFVGVQVRAIARGAPDPLAGKRPKIVTQEELEGRQEESQSAWRRWYNRWFAEKPQKDATDERDHLTPYEIPEQEADRQLVSLWMRVDNPLGAAADQQEALRKLLKLDDPTTLRVEEAFMVWFKVCIMCGIVLGSPWIFYQIWMFVAAGLYPHEKRLVHVYLPVSLGLFLGGVVVCEVFVIPKAIEALLWFNEWMGMRPDVRLNEWLSFAIYMPLIFGLSFQTPLVMLFLARLGVMDINSFRGKRRLMWFIMAVFAAVCTPSTDALSMLFLWVPMSLLYELGIFLIKLSPPPPPIDEDVPEPNEMVEV